MSIRGNKDGFWTVEDSMARARKMINGAKARTGASWRDIFDFCDIDQTGELEWSEFRMLIRDLLRIPAHALSDHDLRYLFRAINVDHDCGVDAAELFRYIEHGPMTDSHREARSKLKQRRVQKALLLACYKLNADQAEAQHLFAAVDLDASNRLSLDEFTHWVRSELHLSRWDMSKVDLAVLYKQVDKNGDGISVQEFWDFLREKEMERARLGPQSLHEEGKLREKRRFRTYRERLLRDVAPHAVSLPQLSPAFTSQGRQREPLVRSVPNLPKLV